MKKILTIVCVAVFAILMVGIIKNPKTGKVPVPDENIGYIEIRRYSTTHKINNRIMIDRIMDEISRMKIKQEHPYQRVLKVFASVPVIGKKYIGYIDYPYRITMYDSDGKNKKIMEISVSNGNKILLDNHRYRCKSGTKPMEWLKEITSYCILPLPEINEKNISKIETSPGRESSKEKVLQIYLELMDSLPVRETEFKESDDYVRFETYDDTAITIYFQEDHEYVRFQQGRNVSYFCKNVLPSIQS